MRNLYYFFRRHYFIFLFLFLEAVSLILFFRYNRFPNAVAYDVSSTVSGTINEIFHEIGEYFSLRRTNFILSQENATLQSRMPEAFYITDTAIYLCTDTLLQREYRYISAKVLSNTTNRRNNFLMISKGSLQGVEPYMGVVTGGKIVGQVVGVSRHFSWVMSMLHKESKISAKFLKNNQLVSVEWPGGDSHEGLVREIPKHILIHPGDTVVTSGNSEVFPNGIQIGIVDQVREQPNENFNTATLIFLTDFNSLGYVEVVVDLFRKEKLQLKRSFQEL